MIPSQSHQVLIITPEDEDLPLAAAHAAHPCQLKSMFYSQLALTFFLSVDFLSLNFRFSSIPHDPRLHGNVTPAMYPRSIFLFVFVLQDVAASFLRVESGHQRILIDGRDPYVGFFTRIIFHEPTCISAVTIHCLKPLTGAEEIDILYSECDHDHWKVAHYTNTKETFTLRNEVVARQLSISSPLVLSIIDVQVESCGRRNLTIPPERCRASHPRRHGKQKVAIRARDYERRRRKRSIEYVLPAVYRADASPYDIPVDVVIPHDRTVVIQPGVTLRFGDEAGFTVHGVLIVNGTKSAPVIFEPEGNQWKGLEFINAAQPSQFSYANISGSSLGITVRSGVPPTIDNVISTSNQYGFDIKTTSNVRITRSSALNSEKTGFRIATKGDVSLDSCLSASNREHGFRIEANGSVSVVDSHAFSNSQHGLLLLGAPPSTVVQGSLISSSGRNGIHLEKTPGRFSTVKIHDVNVTGHYYSAAVEFEDITDVDLEINRCAISDNFNGGVSLDGITANSTITILSSNFTRNRGTTVTMSLIRDSDVIIHGNSFSSNHLNDFGEHEAVLDIATFAEQSGRVVPVSIAKNNFVANLARSVVVLDMPEGEIKANYFSNVQSACEISRAAPVHADTVENYWGHENEADFLPRICALNRSLNYEIFDLEDTSTNGSTHGTTAETTTPSALQNAIGHSNLAVPIVPAARTGSGEKANDSAKISLRPFENTYNQVKAVSEPYSISSEVAVYPGQIVIVEPGTQFEFAPGIGITVQERGKLYLNGTAEHPIRLFGEATWRGLVVKPGGTLVLSHTSIEGASIGLWIDSEKVQVENAQIVDSVVHAVEITANAGPEVDLGHSEILRAKGTGVGVDERKTSIAIRNIAIRDGWGSGIDFVSPTQDVQIENVLVSNGSSYAVHIVEFPAAPLKSVLIRNATVADQSRGHAGVLVTGGWAEEISVDRSTFTRNTVPSLIIGLECHEQPSRTRLTNSTFVNNEETVVHLDVGECGALEVTRNSFLENNNSGQEGVLMVNAQPREGSSSLPLSIEENEFAKNGGEYSAMLSMHGSHPANGSFRGNRLHDNINSVASVVLTSPHYRLESNDFSNPLSVHELDVRSDGSWKVQATGNNWGTDDAKKAFKGPEGSILMAPARFAPLPGGPPPIIPENSDNSQCAHLNFCSHVGRCEGGVCVCPLNYLGLDCSIPTGCPANCSNNGVCDMNKCVCYDGWTSVDCSTPLCRYDCHGHGKCVSRNECECEEGWGGEFCEEVGCRDGTCAHGTCVASKCQCADGWRGSRCSIPICQHCSINGQCVAPDKCQCFDGYEGEDCSICRGPVCQTCDFDCVHGTCERETRTCSCARGWSGAACDVCRSANCQVKSSVFYIMPSTADREDVNVVVNVFGAEFPKTATSAYTCIFGASYSEGQRISSSVVRCRVPRDLSIGRHLFNLAPEGSISVIPNFDVRPIHFTVYDSCSPSLCKGVCIGPLCVCPKGTTGVNCELIEIIPSIDRHFIENQRASIASEGSPYIVVLPTMQGSLHRVNSTIKDLRFDSSRGIIEWAEPIGSVHPYEITVVSNSLSGESSISWNVTVEPSYTAEVNSVSKVDGTNEMRVTGRVRGIKENQSVPVKIWIHEKNDEKPTESIIYSNGTMFTYDYVPEAAGEFTVLASHPGVSPISDGVRFDVPPLQLSIDTSARGAVVRGVEHCDGTMLRPQNGTVSIEQVLANEISMVERAMDWREETVTLLRCDGRRELWRNQLSPRIPHVTAVPSAIALPMGSSRSKVFEVVIYRNGVFLRPPLKLTASDNSQPVFVIASDPDIDQIDASTKYDRIKLALGQNADYREAKNTSLQLVAAAEVMVSVPIYFVPSQSKLSVSICLKDAFDQQPTNVQEAAILSVSNIALGVDDVRSHLRLNQEYVQFSLVEGFYEIMVKAPNYRTVSEVVHITPANTSFCISMEATDPRSLITVGEGGIAIMNVKGAGEIRFPHVEFNPSAINRSDTRILVSVSGHNAGLVSMAPFQNDVLILTPSVRSVAVNSSFWITVEWKGAVTSSAGCNARVISVPFLFLADSSNELTRVSFDLVVVANDADYKHWKVCDGANRPVPVAYSTTVTCDCSQGARTRCRRKYKSAAACGSAWKRISDDTVSLQVLSTYFLLLTDCKSVHVNMTELDEAMQCVSSLESECPILHRRRRSVSFQKDPMLGDGPVDVINHLSSVNGQVPAVLSPMLPILNALDMQSIRMATLYSDFVQKIQKIFPPRLTDPLTNDVIEKFLAAIGDGSEQGVAISPAEADQFEDKELVKLWNATVNDWTSGRMDSPSENQGIPYSDVKQLVVTADRLHSLTRQNGASDPFSLLHEYIGQILTTNDSRDEECLAAAVVVDPVVIYEDSSVTIDVYIESLQDTTLTNIDLSIDFVRNDMFAPRINFGVGPSWSAGINTMNGFGILAARSSFEMHWTRKIIAENRLTTSAFYQALIVLGFHRDGMPSKQRLKSPLLEIRPRRSIRVLHFVNGDVTNSLKEPFSAMTAVMNIGYSPLTDVRVLHTDIDLVTSSVAAPFDIVRMELDGKRIGSTLTPVIGDIKSGTSRRITYHITTPGQAASFANMSTVLTVDGKLVPVEDEHIYSIKAAASEKDGFIVSSLANPEPVFFYRPDIGSIVNIVPLQYSTTHVKTTDDPKKFAILASFRNLLSPGFTGALWGTFKLPSIPDNYRLTRVIDQRGARTRVVTPVTWTEQQDEGKVLNFIDSGAAFPVSDIVYEMEFSEPTKEAGPEFDQTSYRVQIFPGAWPQPGFPLAAISAHSPESSNLTYSLYTPDNEKAFAVDPHTGELFLMAPVPPGDEFCTLLVARDQLGQEKRVPVAINTGGPRRECVMFDTEGLSSSTYHGPHRGSIGPWFPIEPPTMSPTEQPATPYTTLPDSSPPTPPTPWIPPDSSSQTPPTPWIPVTTPTAPPTTSQQTLVPHSSTEGTTTVTTAQPSTTTDSADQVSTQTAQTSELSTTSPVSWTTDTIPITPTSSTDGFPTPIETISPETSTTVTVVGSSTISTDEVSPSMTTSVSESTTTITSTTAEMVEPTYPTPISPDSSPQTLPHPWTTATETAPPIFTITPDTHPQPITQLTSTTDGEFPTPPLTVLPDSHMTATAMPQGSTAGTLAPSQTPETLRTTTEVIITITPDSSPETVPQVTWTGSTQETTHSVSIDHTLPTVPSSTQWAEPTTVVTTPPELSTVVTGASTVEPVVTMTPDTTLVTMEPTQSVLTVNPEEGTTHGGFPTVLPPVIIPTGGGATLATFATTAKPKTTLDPYYGMACSKRGEPIWDLICELSKTSIRKD
ncbi:hypothetical protein Y032_0194g1447 [Ancylostoma ceylanicum]|uniref:EGF-like domain-containing protein n=1 Tax=Ancylostoma ceylanicum TaxID=53326 RepID=A0A016SQ12_9BILA|nr:hypothetical protein Y032_0194g1447 [Ancylostoma ceylanicum]